MKSEEARDMALNACLQSNICHYDSDIMIYKETNENLKALFEKYSVRDKDVLTVLASSDQLFSCYYSKAKSIDAFDRIPITLFYYYLRKWVILYQNKLYPSHLFFDENGDRNLYRLICNITPSCVDEANAKVFWKCYLEHNNYGTDKYLFYLSFVSQPKPFDHSLEDIKGVFDKELLFFDRNFFNPFKFIRNMMC